MHIYVKLLKRREIFVILINSFAFFFSYIFEVTDLKLVLHLESLPGGNYYKGRTF